jgi:hypothetical protein
VGTLEQKGSCLSTEHGHIATNIYSHHNHGASMAHRSAFAQSSLLHLRRPATRPTRSANALTTYFTVPFRMYQRPHTQSGGGKSVFKKKGGYRNCGINDSPQTAPVSRRTSTFSSGRIPLWGCERYSVQAQAEACTNQA